MNRKNLFKLIPVFLIICYIFSLIGCYKSDPIKVGFSVGLTGRSSELGVSGRNGIEIAVDNINKAGGINGRKIELIIKDDEENPDIAIKVDKELIEKGVVAIIGHLTSGTAKAGLSFTNEKNVLVISPTVSTDSLSGIDDNFIRVIASNKYQGELLAQAAIKINKTKKVAAVYEWTNRAYTEELIKHFKNKFEELGGNVILINNFTSGNDANLKKVAQDMVESGADGMVVIAGGVDTAVICQHIQMLKPKTPVYSGMWALTEDLIKNGGKAVENELLPSVYDNNSKNERYIKFKEEYVSRYNMEPTFSSIYSYDTAQVLFKALKDSKDLSSQTIKNSILKIREFEGLQDSFKIDAYGDTDRKYFLFTIRDGQFIRVD